MHKSRKVIIEYNPHRTLVLVLVGGKVVASTAGGVEGSYVGMDEGEARCAAGSVMRYKVGSESGADGYPSTRIVHLPLVEPPEED